ncbi:GNAT family N-acetyltransferase [Aequorivita capsosiphonis]|uniref:GNAT family N-acetyltransferase n=1 Tax=Aequorivita capsosiphonis TaxID=487317 RepID=UPI00041F930B|nr:GNAT family protein [Aequorivita capsosiphonis]
MNIQGKNIKLRAIEKEDLELLNKWANTVEIQYWLEGWHFPTNMEDQLRWFSSFSVNSINQRFVIEAPELGVIGTANLVDIDWKNRNAFHGMMLGDKEIRGKGYGLETVMAIMKYAFEELGFQRLNGSMIAYNAASLRLYVGKCGWKEEGRQRNYYFKKNQFWDKIIVGITRDDYFELVKQNNYWEDK